MTQLRLLTALLLLCFSTSLLQGQNYSQRTYDLGFSDRGYAAEVSPNGDILLAGRYGPAGFEKTWILKTTAQGGVLWSKQFEDNGLTIARDIRRTSDGNFLVAFNKMTNNSTVTVGAWMKISGAGEVLWSKTASFNSEFKKILPLASGGYLLTGNAVPTSFLNALAVKIDENGNVVWVANFGDSGDDEIEKCWEDDQGFIYCAGYSADTDLNPDGLLAKIGPNGSILWARRYRTGNITEEFAGVAPFSGSSDLLLAGHTVSPLFEYDKIWLTRVTSAGDVKWSRTYELPDLDIAAIDVVSIPGDQFVISAAKLDNSIGSPAILMKIAQNGNLLWKYEYKTGGERAIFRKVIPVADGFVAAGSAVRNGDEDIYMAHVGPEGLMPGTECCPASVSLAIKDVSPEMEIFTPGTQAGFVPLNDLVVGSDVMPAMRDVCTPVDLSFSVSDTSICPGECIDITLVGNTGGVIDSILTPGGIPDSTQPGRICYPNAGTFFITRQGTNGVCDLKKFSKKIEVGTRPDAFPNAFTPNGDGVNDTYKPLFFCPVLTTHFIVFNRWGQKVFETRDPDKAWDGKVNGKDAPSDVYGWRVEYEAIREGSQQKLTAKGDVTLLR